MVVKELWADIKHSGKILVLDVPISSVLDQETKGDWRVRQSMRNERYTEGVL